MKKQDLQKLIKEELKKALNESRDIEWSEYEGKKYPVLIPNGTQITVDGELGTITSNFMNRGDEFATYKVTLDSGNQIEISSADSSIKMLDESMFSFGAGTPRRRRSSPSQRRKSKSSSRIEFEEVVPNGTIIYINGKKARVRANFRNSDGPSILFDYIEDNGLRGEPGTVALNNPTIDQREVDLKITDEITEIFSDNKAIRANARQAQLLSRRVLSRMGDLNTYIKRSNQAPDLLNAIVSLTKEDLEKLKKLLLLVHADHLSVKGSLEYVYEIQQETKNMRPIEVMSVLGSGEVIKEYIEKVVKPLKKIIIF